MNYCNICRNKDISAINLQLIEGVPLRTIAKEFNCGVSSLHTHKTKHLGDVIEKSFKRVQKTINKEIIAKVEELEVQKYNESFDIISTINKGLFESQEIYRINKEKKNYLICLKALAEIRNYSQLGINTLAQINASKQLEIELARAKQDGTSEEEKEEFNRKLQVFSYSELEMLEKLAYKFQEQTPRRIVRSTK